MKKKDKYDLSYTHQRSVTRKKYYIDKKMYKNGWIKNC
jgi:hypothetical protein